MQFEVSEGGIYIATCDKVVAIEVDGSLIRGVVHRQRRGQGTEGEVVFAIEFAVGGEPAEEL